MKIYEFSKSAIVVRTIKKTHNTTRYLIEMQLLYNGKVLHICIIFT